MSSSFHSPEPRSSPWTPSIKQSASSSTPYSHISQRSSSDQDLRSPPSLLRSQSASAAHYSQQAQHHIVALHQQDEMGTPNNPIELTPTATPPRTTALSAQQQRSRSTPTSILARYSFPARTPSSSNNNHTTPSPRILHTSSWTHPSSTRSADDNNSYAGKLHRLLAEYGKLKESHQALHTDNKQLKSQTDDLKSKTVQLEARLLESMQARSAREQKFQEEMKRQRASMNSLFTELADSKREVELLKKQLKDTSTKLQLQQALTANIAFQLEQEELEYQMEQEQFQKQQEGGIPSEAAAGSHYPKEDVPSTIASSKKPPGDSGFSRLGNFFNRRRQVGGGAMSAMGTITSTEPSVTSSSAAPSLGASESSEIGQFHSYEESKNDLIEQMQDHYGGGVHKSLFDLETTTTVTTEDSSSNPASSKFELPSEDYLKITTPPKATKSPRRQQTPEEMNYGQTSASMPPPARMTRLDRIRQKRRNLESMFRQNGASSSVMPVAKQPTTSGLPPRRGRTNFQAKTPSQNLNRNLVNLMNHRRYDD